MEARWFKVWLMLVIMKSYIGEECLPSYSAWKVSLIFYQEGTVSVSWQTESVFCTDKVIISQLTDIEETISLPVKVSMGQTIVKVMDKCKLYTIRLAALLPGRNEVKSISLKRIS